MDKRGRMIRKSSNDAVSEAVGAILLLALTVVGASVVALVMFSQPLPEEMPSVEMIISNVSQPDEKVLIRHNGGDVLREKDFIVYVDGNAMDNSVAAITGGDGNWPFSLGEVISYTVPSSPNEVRVIYAGGSASAILKSAILGGEVDTGGADVVPAVIPTPTPGGDCEQYLEDNYVEYFLEQLNDGSVYLTRTDAEDGFLTGSFVFTVEGPGSYLVDGSENKIYLFDGDQVEINIPSSTQRRVWFSAFMVGEKGWTLTGIRESGGTVLNVLVNGGSVITNNLRESWIIDYSSFTSTMDLSVGGGDWHTKLIIENTTLIDGKNSQEIVLTNIRPADPTLMIIDYPANSGPHQNVVFLGEADQVTVDGVVVYP